MSLASFSSGHYVEVLSSQECSRVSYEGNSQGIYPFDEIPTVEICFRKISYTSKKLFFNFFSFFSTCLSVYTSNILKYLYVSFSLALLILYWFGSCIPAVVCLFFSGDLLIWAIHSAIFSSKPLLISNLSRTLLTSTTSHLLLRYFFECYSERFQGYNRLKSSSMSFKFIDSVFL